MKRYKFLRENLKSENGNCIWKKGEWQHADNLKICESGFHCSRQKYQAFSYVQGEILAEVEVKGKSIKQDDKECWSDMRISHAWKWQKKDSVALAIYCAELVLKNFEKEYPDDKRPREAIEAAKKWLKDPTDKNAASASAASSASASAASYAYASASAAYASASAASAAAYASASASASAASYAASYAAYAASASVSSAAALIKKISQWFDKRKLEKIF